MHFPFRVLVILPFLLGLSLVGAAVDAEKSVQSTENPAQVAINFLKTLRSTPAEELKEPHKITALSQETTLSRRTEITSYLRNLQATLYRDGELAVVDSKQQGKLAVAIIAQTPQFDPARAQLHVVSLIQQEGRWMPAPIPGSFENLGIDYLPQQNADAQGLLDWVKQKLPIYHKQLSSTLYQKIHSQLLGILPPNLKPGEPDYDDPKAWLQVFLNASSGRNLPLIMASLGGLENPPQKGWESSISKIREALYHPRLRHYEEYSFHPLDGPSWDSFTNDPGPWHIEKLSYSSDRKSATATVLRLYIDNIGNITPTDVPPVYAANFSLTHGEQWKIVLNNYFTNPTPPPLTQATPEQIQSFFHNYIKKFPRPDKRDFAALAPHAIHALTADTPGPLLSYLANEYIAQEVVKTDKHPWSAILALWSQARNSNRPALFLESYEDSTHAYALWCTPNVQDPLITPYQMHLLHFAKQEDATWALDFTRSPRELNEQENSWINVRKKQDTATWLSQLGLNTTLDKLLPEPGPNLSEAQQTMEAWLAGLANKDLRQILRHSVIFDVRTSPSHLSNTIAGDLASFVPLKLLQLKARGPWAAASVLRVSAKPKAEQEDTNRKAQDPEKDYLFIPLVRTSSGVRVLGEISLHEKQDKSNDFLNEQTWDRLKDKLSQSEFADLQKLFQEHCESVLQLSNETP